MYVEILNSFFLPNRALHNIWQI